MTDPVTPWLIALALIGAVAGAGVLTWIVIQATTGGSSLLARPRSPRAHQAHLPTRTGLPERPSPAAPVNTGRPACATPRYDGAQAAKAGQGARDRTLHPGGPS